MGALKVVISNSTTTRTRAHRHRPREHAVAESGEVVDTIKTAAKQERCNATSSCTDERCRCSTPNDVSVARGRC
jgi:hypothetical protein